MTDASAEGLPADISDQAPGFTTCALELLLARDHATALCGLTLDGRVRFWHASAQRLLGYSASDVTGRRLDGIVPAEYRREGLIARALFGASASGEAHLDLPLLSRAGERVACRLTARPQPEIDPGFVVLIRETDADADLRSQHRERCDLWAAHRANLTRVDGEPGWIALNLEGEIEHVSPRCAEVLDVTAGQWTARPLAELLCPAGGRVWHELMHRSVSSAVPQQTSVNRPAASASDLCWPVTLLALYESDGEPPVGFTLALGNPEKAAERRTAPAAGVRQSPERAWFNAAVHDLRVPLRQVRERLDALRQDQGEAPGTDGTAAVERIDATLRRLQENIDGILRLARMAREPFAGERIDLDAVLAAVLEDLSPLLRRHAATVHIEQLGVVWGDPAQLRLLFQNLIDNSIRYHRSGRPPEIRIHRFDEAAAGAPGLIRFGYTDNARGFDDPATVFGDQPAGHVEGTGIGLDICRRIARRHRGELEIAKSDAQGTTFLISLGVPAPSATTNERQAR